MKIGIILAVELQAILEHYPQMKEVSTTTAFRLFKVNEQNHEIFILQTGVGLVYASSGTQYLISSCHVEMIINYGVVGALVKEMNKYQVAVVKEVIHSGYDCSDFENVKPAQICGRDEINIPLSSFLIEKALKVNPSLKKVVCTSSDRFIESTEEKTMLHNKFNADICDMEIAGITLTCIANNIPMLSLKAVSDALSEGANEYKQNYNKAAKACLDTIDGILANI